MVAIAKTILHCSGLEYVRDMAGLAKKMPYVCACFLAAGAGLIGVPPMAAFVSKWARNFPAKIPHQNCNR